MVTGSVCVLCGGEGRLVSICDVCQGTRKIEAGKPCKACNGLGIKTKTCIGCSGTGSSDEQVRSE